MSTFLRWCSRCETNFTRTNWQLHGHNPAQINCTSPTCRHKAVGYSGTEYTPTPLCGEHVMEARRSGSTVTFVDGRVCRMCDGHGWVHAQEMRVESPGGQWLRCPDCLGTGYDPTLRPSSRRSTETQPQPQQPEAATESRGNQPERREVPSSWGIREEQYRTPSSASRPVPQAQAERQPPYIPPTITSRHEPPYEKRRGNRGLVLFLLTAIFGLVGVIVFLVYHEESPLRRQEVPASSGPPAIAPSPTPFPTATPRPTPTLPPTALPVISPPIATAEPTATVVPSPIPTATAIPTPTSTPTATPQPTPATEDLRQLALDLINRDRADNGLPSVVLGSNVAAQRHANDMLEHNYQGHWWADGSKPYMVYTRTGGRSYVAENVASWGWTDQEWAEDGCDSILVRCIAAEPSKAITELQHLMVYDDAHADWGHRDNILRESHRSVNVGIAFNDRRVTFVQHFEGGVALARGAPELSEDNILSLVVDKKEEGIQIGGVVSVYYDPPPTPMSPQAIETLDSYCVGGGATARCGDEVATILEPLGAGYYYANLQPSEVVAQSWLETPEYFILGADMGNLMSKPGVYTVIVWRDTGGTWLEEVLIKLSVFVE